MTVPISQLIKQAEQRATNMLNQATTSLSTATSTISGLSAGLREINPPEFERPEELNIDALTRLNEPPNTEGISAAISNAFTALGEMPTLEGGLANARYTGPGGAPTFAVPAPTFTAPTSPDAKPRLAATKPALLDTPALSNVTIPNPPPNQSVDIVEPIRPAATPTFTKVAPTINTLFPAPAKPANFTGAIPTMTDVVMPARPTRNAPVFDGQRPETIERAPDVRSAHSSAWTGASASFRATVADSVSEMFSTVQPLYADMESKLLSFVRGDTETGFTPEVEDAIYSRSRSKQDAEARRVSDDAMLRAARMGFTLPTGALNSALNKTRQAAADNNTTSSREIVVMQAEMQQKNMQMALQLSGNLKQTVVQAGISYHGNMIQLNGQAVQFASGVVDALVKTYELTVQAMNAQLDMYKADATVFETLVQASMAEIEVYKAEIQAELAKVQVDEARVKLFQSQVDAHQATVQTYSTEVQALVALSNLERFKLEAFESEVKAYMALVDASKAEWQAYSAAWSGEETKVKALLAQAQIYTAQVEGYKGTVQADATRIDAISRVNASKLEAYASEVRAFSAEVDAYRAEWAGYAAAWSGEEAKQKAYSARTQAYGAEVEAYRAGILAATSEFEASAKSDQLALSVYEAKVRAWGEKARSVGEQANAAIKAQETLLQGYQVGAQAVIQAAGAEAERFKAMASYNIETAKIAAMFSLDQAKVQTDALGAISQTNLSASQMYRGLAEAALSGVTTMVTLKEDITAA